MKIAFVYAGGREAKWKSALAGDVPSDFFYGAVELARNGHEIICIDAPENPRGLLATLYNRLLGWHTPVRTRGEHLVAVGAILDRLRGVDAVVATATSHALALAMWRRCKVPIVGIHCGLVNFPLQRSRLRATARALKQQEVVLFADSEEDETVQRFQLDSSHVHVNAFGVDTDFWTTAEISGGGGVLAVGNDGRRDYSVLVKASPAIEARVTIVTARDLPAPLPANVAHIRGSWHRPALSDGELRDRYRSADVVVVPLKDSLQPSGQSVALQAMACGCAVVMTRTQGLWTGDEFRDGEHLLLVEPADERAMKEAVTRLLDDPSLCEKIGGAARAAVLFHGTMRNFATRLENLLARVTSHH